MNDIAATYTFIRGATQSVALDVVQGFAGEEPIRAVLKAAQHANQPPGDGAVEAAVFSIAFVAAESDTPAHWLLTLSAEQTAALSPGWYLADARIEVAGGVFQTAAIRIRIVERISEAA